MKTRNITINCKKDYDKFVKKLNLYKSILFFNTYFKVNGKYFDELRYIIDALNIKNRRKRISYVYDSACKIIDDNNKKYRCDMCGFRNGKCYAQINTNKSNGCCRMCLYQSNSGCKTKNLTCKLFNCSEVTKRFNTLKYEDLDILRLLSIKNRILIKSDYFSSKEDVLKDLYSISLTYSTIRVLYRLIKTFILISKKNIK